MKTIKILKYLAFSLSLFLTFSCSSDSDTFNVSSVTKYANFTYDKVVSIPVGGTYTPNVVATAGGVNLPVTQSGTVNTNVVGAYDVQFSATNADGYDAKATQTVVVYTPGATGTDVTGKIRDKNNNSRTGVITKVAGSSNIYYCTDFGFGGAFPVYFKMVGNTPSQINQVYAGYDPATSVAMTYNPTTKIFTTAIAPYGYSYTFEYY
jgi:hypothetical protein